MSPSARRPLINRRRAARLAAVQALYQLDLVGGRAAAVVAEFSEHRLAGLLEPILPDQPSPQVDREWFMLLVRGAWAGHERLDLVLEGCLGENWTLERCGFLLRALLRAGAYELAERTDVPVAVVINEYVEVAKLFAAGTESGFVHAALDKAAPQLRDPVAAV